MKNNKGNENVHSGFYSNKVIKNPDNGIEEIATSLNGQFDKDCTVMRLWDLHERAKNSDIAMVDSYDIVMRVVLKQLVKHEEALREGKVVDVYVEWTLSEDQSEYTSCKFIKNEVHGEDVNSIEIDNLKDNKKKKAGTKRRANNRYGVVSHANQMITDFYEKYGAERGYELLTDMYEEIGEYCGISPSTVAQIRLKNLQPSYVVAVKLSEFLGVEPSEIWEVVQLEDYKGPEKPLCKVDGCERMAVTKGYCMRHVYMTMKNNKNEYYKY